MTFDPILVPISTSKAWSVPIRYPANLAAIGSAYARARVNLWPLNPRWGDNPVGNDDRIVAMARAMNFVQAAQQARIAIDVGVSAVSRPPNVVLAVSIHAGFDVDRYYESDHTGVIYQDIARLDLSRYTNPANPGSSSLEAITSQGWSMTKVTVPPWLLSTSTTEEAYDAANPMTLVFAKFPIATIWLKDPQAEAVGHVDIE